MRDDYIEMTAQEYETLYASYLMHPTRLLVAPDPPIPLTEDTKLLDLCTGPGTIVKAAVKMGVDARNIIAVDESKSIMIGSIPRGVLIVVSRVTPNLCERLKTDGQFDLITCRDAVNYWCDWWTIKGVVGLLRSGGAFVFNTFNREPSEQPHAKHYVNNDGKHCTEVIWLVNKIVHHVQIIEGMKPHYKTFLWIHPDTFERCLKHMEFCRYISIWTRVRDGATDTYVVRGVE